MVTTPPTIDILTTPALCEAESQRSHDIDDMSRAMRAVPIALWVAFCEALNPKGTKRPPEQDHSLLGEEVIDKLSGQRAEVLGYDSQINQYKIEFQDGGDLDLGDNSMHLSYWGGNHGASRGQMQPYERGHCAWRYGHELLRTT